MISRFFIDRPIFASVISILIVLAGLASMITMPIEQYPNITPPQILVSANYPGANAEIISNTLASPLENQINGTENMIYMYSQNASTGAMNLNVFFDIGTNINEAQINVQNAVNLALPRLPEEVRKTGVNVQKQSPNILLVIAIQSPGDRYDQIFLSNYASINIVDELKRVKGISNASIIGARDYSMRVWLRPDRLAQLKISTAEILNAIREQNALFAVGQIGQPPNSMPIDLTLSINTLGRLSEPEEFENIILRANDDGSMVFLKDVAKVELGAENYDVNTFMDGKQTIMIATYQQYGANALELAQNIRDKMEEIAKDFPPGIDYSVPYDTTLFVNASIKEVGKTIFEAAVLVAIVVFVFLQNLRATVIPLLAMVVSIVGTFAGMYLFGFSINTLTLFGMVLAVGTVVDDAIVVIENVERNMREFGLSGKEAAQRAMDEVTGPVIAIVFVLCAVFIPVAFLGGIAGQLYKQFAITISISVFISGIVALTLSPAISAIILKKDHTPSRFSKWFNSRFDQFTNGYVKIAKWFIERPKVVFGALITLCLLTFVLFYTVPSSFVPGEDQGYLIAIGNLPDGSSTDRTSKVSDQILKDTLGTPGVSQLVTLDGFSLIDGLQRNPISTNFIVLDPWGKRRSSELQADSILQSLQQKYFSIQQAQVFAFNPPAIQGLGAIGGFEFWIENRGEASYSELENITNELIAKSRNIKELEGLFSPIQTNTLQLFVDLDRAKASTLGVPIDEIFLTLQTFLGTYYVNDFNKFGRTYKVMVQAEPDYREDVADIGELWVKSKAGEMIPLKSLVQINYSRGPTLVSRFNGFPAAQINGSAAPGYSSGDAMKAMEKLAKEVLPEGMTYSWGGESYQENKSSGSADIMLITGLLMVFLILSALYERWALPLVILLAVPFGIFGAFFAIWAVKLSNDVYFQVGLVTLIALAAKNAILIVEFAVIKKQEGMGTLEAALEAAKLRFRAILMTSFTFIFGVIPLVTSQGAGAASRISVGTGVLGGMIAATFFAVLFVPLFYKSVEEWFGRKKNQEEISI